MTIAVFLKFLKFLNSKEFIALQADSIAVSHI